MRYSARTFLSAVPFLIVAALLLAPPAPAQTGKCGDICGEVWDVAGSPYVINCDVHVWDSVIGCSLTIQAGVEVRFQPGTYLIIGVDNSLDVQGASMSPVTFTSNQGTPGPGDYGGIRLNTGSSATINYADIEYAGNAISTSSASLNLTGGTIENNSATALDLRDTAATIADVTVRNNNYGLHAYGGGTMGITGSTFTLNNIGIYVGGDNAAAPGFTMRDSAIHDNSSLDLYSAYVADPDNTLLDARHNWWGSTDTAVIRSHISDHADWEAGSPLVDWCGFLGSAGGSPVTTYECPELLICDETVTWNVTARPYLLTTEAIVCPTGRLEVGPDVEVRVARHNELNILVNGGQVDIDASSGSAAVFTSDELSPGPGYWRGFRVYRTIDVTPSLEISNASIAYAYNGIEAYDDAVVMLDTVDISNNSLNGMYFREDASVTLTDVTAQNNLEYGLRVHDNVTLGATGCTFTNNSASGVTVQWYSAGSGAFSINDSSIHTNYGGHDLYTYNATDPAETVLDFKNNWWGTDSTGTIQARIEDHTDSATSPIVDWCPWLEAAPPAAVARDVECPDLSVCSGTVRWDVTTRPYLLVTDVYVCPPMRLEIGPGVEVRSILTSSGIEILVDGELIVEGTAAEPVSFRSDQSVPYKLDWQGITSQGTGFMVIENATVQHAKNGLWGKEDTSTVLENVAVTDCGPTGLYFEGNATVWMTNVLSSRNDLGLYAYGNCDVIGLGCTFTENQSYGIGLYGTASYNPLLKMTGSSIHSNYGAYDLHANQVADPDTWKVWASDCWWGTEDENQIASRIYDHEDNAICPRVYFRPYGADCEPVIGRDNDDDGAGDFEDNCPIDFNVDQTDADADGMGDPCDPYPGAAPTGNCDGSNDDLDGYADADSDGWGDPCDHQPTRDDSHPGVTEICDARDNDGDIATSELDEYSDDDLDGNIDCYDCDDYNPDINSCNCENCTNFIDDDCDLMVDGADPSCEVSDTCILFAGEGPEITLYKGVCGGGTPTLYYDVIRGDVGQLGFTSGSVDLGRVQCYPSLLADRFTDSSADPDLACDDTPIVFYLVKEDGDADFGTASSGEARDIMTPPSECSF
jgi:hypothetical protein